MSRSVTRCMFWFKGGDSPSTLSSWAAGFLFSLPPVLFLLESKEVNPSFIAVNCQVVSLSGSLVPFFSFTIPCYRLFCYIKHYIWQLFPSPWNTYHLTRLAQKSTSGIAFTVVQSILVVRKGHRRKIWKVLLDCVVFVVEGVNYSRLLLTHVSCTLSPALFPTVKWSFAVAATLAIRNHVLLEFRSSSPLMDPGDSLNSCVQNLLCSKPVELHCTITYRTDRPGRLGCGPLGARQTFLPLV